MTRIYLSWTSFNPNWPYKEAIFQLLAHASRPLNRRKAGGRPV